MTDDTSTADDLVSVVVPTYNGARFVEATLRSIRAQTHPRVEVIVVDDGSTDGTADLVRGSFPDAIVVEQANRGVAVARNRGLSTASGAWVGFIDQDDLWLPDRLTTLLRAARRHDVRAVASTEVVFAARSDRDALRAVGDGREHWPTHWIDDGGEDRLRDTAPAAEPHGVERITIERMLQGAAMLTTSVLYDRRTALDAGAFVPHARALDDHLLNMNVARISGPILRIDSRDVLYRVHSSSTTTVSPMVGPFLSGIASVRLGGMVASEQTLGPNVEHLLHSLAVAPLSTSDQLGLLLLTVPKGARGRWLLRWVRRSVGRRVRARAVRRRAGT